MIYQPLPITKVCRMCGQETPAIKLEKSRFNSFGVRPICRTCANAKQRAYRATIPDKVKRWKQQDAIKNKQHIQEHSRHYYEANRERVKEKTRMYRIAHQDKYNEYCRNFTKKHPERANEIKRQYIKQHPELRTIWKQRRRARVQSLPDAFTAQDWQRCLDYFDHRCAVCERPVGLWHTLAADHWIPLTSPDCPGTIPTNIIPLCHGIDGCNNRKNDKPAEQWLTEEYGKRKAQQILARIKAYIDSLSEDK